MAFGLIHLDLRQGLFAVGLGLLYGGLRLYSGGLLLPTLAHMTNNLVAVVTMRSAPPTLAGESTDPTIAILLVAVTLAASAAFVSELQRSLPLKGLNGSRNAASNRAS
jgi:membrane protease YdiL (CAAX protease family)